MIIADVLQHAANLALDGLGEIAYARGQAERSSERRQQEEVCHALQRAKSHLHVASGVIDDAIAVVLSGSEEARKCGERSAALGGIDSHSRGEPRRSNP